MDNHIDIYRIFDKAPLGWGLRGDPYLWHEVRGYFVHQKTAVINNPRELEALIEKAFHDLTGNKLNSENFQIERLMHGGMSSGAICTRTWSEKIIPHLLQNYEELIRGGDRQNR